MVNFLLLLHLRLSKPQHAHLVRLSEALVVCQEPHKTLAALNRQWVEAPDVSTDAHFLRQSPWSQHEMRAAVAEFMLRDLIEQAQAEGAEPVLYISLDDSKADKDEATTKLEAVDWTHDHHKSTKRRPVYVKAASHVSVRVQIGHTRTPSGSTCERRPCDGSTASVQRPNGFGFAANTVWRERCSKTSRSCCVCIYRKAIAFTFYLTRGTPQHA